MFYKLLHCRHSCEQVSRLDKELTLNISCSFEKRDMVNYWQCLRSTSDNDGMYNCLLDR